MSWYRSPSPVGRILPNGVFATFTDPTAPMGARAESGHAPSWRSILRNQGGARGGGQQQVNGFLNISLRVSMGGIGTRQWFAQENICFGHVHQGTRQHPASFLETGADGHGSWKIEDFRINPFVEELIH